MVEETGPMSDDPTVVVTGASSGIGEATARALAESGASVVLAARRASELESIADEIDSAGGDALVVPTDVTNENNVDTLVETTIEEFGSIDVLVNNAGVMLLEPVERADRGNFRQMIEVNLLGVMILTHAVLPIMQEQGAGHIVNVSSTSGRVAEATAAGYNASKFGINGFTEALRQEVTSEGLRTTLIEPGATMTELSSHIPDEEVKQQLEESLIESITPLQPEDIAQTISYVVTQPQRVDINEVLVRPTGQQS